MKKTQRKTPDSPNQHEPQRRSQTEEPRDQANAGGVLAEGGKDAFKQLRRAVKKKVREQSAKIAESLVKSTLEGNSSSARIMVSLVEKKKKKKNSEPEENKPVHSLALDLASDPQCPPEDDDWAREEERSAREPDADLGRTAVPGQDGPHGSPGGLRPPLNAIEGTHRE
jgi:hypothetical protein